MNPGSKQRWLWAAVAGSGLVLTFLFQRLDIALLLGIKDTFWCFVVNRSIRFILNDALAILLIYALFYERKYVLFAVWVQVLGLVLVLIPYFIIKAKFPSYNGPLISFLHRLVLNPTILLLLVPAFYYQKNKA